MPVEIERKFLVIGDEWRKGAVGIFYRQGYTHAAKICVPFFGKNGFVVIKSETLSDGIKRKIAVTVTIPRKDAKEIFDTLCNPQNNSWEWMPVAGFLFRQRPIGKGGLRVRIAGDAGFITMKGKTLPDAPNSRPEYEYPLPVAEARDLLDYVCDSNQIEKTRYCIENKGHVWEVDEFHGANAPLISAEIEMHSETEAFDKPVWLGEEVSADPRYLNANLAKAPYSTWATPQP